MEIVNQQLLEDLEEGVPIKLHLGAGGTALEGYYNVDIVNLPGTDVVADLNDSLDKIPDNVASEVYTRHTLEHIDNFIGLMGELHRICRSDAELKIVVPHFSNPYYYSDPTHVKNFGLYTMHYFMDEGEQPGRKVPSFYTGIRFSLLDLRIDFYRTSLFDRLLVPLIRGLVNYNFLSQEIYERRWVWIMPAWQINYHLRPIKSEHD